MAVARPYRPGAAPASVSSGGGGELRPRRRLRASRRRRRRRPRPRRPRSAAPRRRRRPRPSRRSGPRRRPGSAPAGRRRRRGARRACAASGTTRVEVAQRVAQQHERGRAASRAGASCPRRRTAAGPPERPRTAARRRSPSARRRCGRDEVEAGLKGVKVHAGELPGPALTARWGQPPAVAAQPAIPSGPARRFLRSRTA